MATNVGGTAANEVARNWWLILVRGVVALLFGILALIWPHITLMALVLLFGIYALIDGFASFARAYTTGQRGGNWVWPVIGGVLGIAAGIAAFVWPGITALILLFIIAAWAIIIGVSDIIASIALRDEINHMWLQLLGGVIAVLFGVIAFVYPGAGALALVWLIGIFAIVLGITRIGLAFQVRKWPEQGVPGAKTEMPPARPATA